MNNTRIDVKLPVELYDAIEAVAQQQNAKLHHRSGRPILKETVIELLKIGLANHAENVSDTSEESTRNISDTEEIDNRIQLAIAPIIADVEALKKAIRQRSSIEQSAGTVAVASVEVMGLDEAFELLKTRGFRRSKTTLRKNLRKPDKSADYKTQYGIELIGFNEYRDLWNDN